MDGVFSARRRPFSVPDSLVELDGPSAAGTVSLPPHLDWSNRRTYDLADRVDRLRVYEQVLREGTLEDLRCYVDATELGQVLDELFLPDEIREAWHRLLVERVA